MQKVKLIKVDFNSDKSVKQWETQRAKLENAGYALKETLGGFDSFVLVYKKLIN